MLPSTVHEPQRVPAGLSEWQIRERVKLWFQDEARRPAGAA
jgi:hypothetical protein